MIHDDDDDDDDDDDEMCCGCVSGRMDVALRTRVQMTPSRDWQDSQFYHCDF